MMVDHPRDYSRIHYYIDAMGIIWHGPFCPDDIVHWKPVNEIGVRASDLPAEAVEITGPYQAAQYIRRLLRGRG